MTTWPLPHVPPDDWPPPKDPYAKQDWADLLKLFYTAQLSEVTAVAGAKTDAEAATEKVRTDAEAATEKVRTDAEAATEKVRTDAEAVALKVQSDATVKQEDEDWQARKAGLDAEIALYKSIHDARVEVSKGGIERGQAGAEFVRNAAAGIVTLYTGLLGLVFGTAGGKVPATGIIPAIFLGFSLAAAAFYVAFLTRTPAAAAPLPSDSLRVLADRRINVFVDWVSEIALNRAYALHAAVVALAFGVAFLPVAFANIKVATAWNWFWVAAVVNLLVPVATARLAQPVPSTPGGK